MPEPDERATAAPGALAAGPTPPHRSLWQDVFRTGFSLRFVAAGGVPTRVLEAGDGPPLLLLHGTGGHLEAFMRNVSALAERFRVIVCDMVGHGFSGKPDVPYTVDYLSDHVVAVLDALGIEHAHISGESLGGWVAAWVAAHHPERVDRLILSTPGNVAARPEVMARIKESSLKAVAEADRANVRARLEWLFHDKSQVTDELVDVRLAIYAQPGFLRTMENILVLQDPEVRQRYTWRPEWCGKVRAPTLIVWTDNDPTGTVEEGRQLLEWIPGSRMHVIEDAGHWPQWEQPDEFHRLHFEFLLAAEGAA